MTATMIGGCPGQPTTQRVATDLKLLELKGNWFATILDRSPNDGY